MRPLPVEPLAGVPDFVRGVCVIRGEAVPLIDGATLLGGVEQHPSRLVTIAAGGRRAALLVGAVLGVRDLSGVDAGQLPGLLTGVASESVALIGSLDADLLMVLEGSRLVPQSVWAIIDASVAAR